MPKRRPKIGIYKNKQVNTSMKRKKPLYRAYIQQVFAQDPDDTVVREGNNKGKVYPLLPQMIRTEKQLMRFIYDNFGEGHYHILSYRHMKLLWKGNVNAEGFQQVKSKVKKDDLQETERDLQKAEDEEEYYELMNDYHQEKKNIKEEEQKKNKKQSLYPFFRYSSHKRGEFIYWEDPDIGLTQPQRSPEKQINKSPEDMTIDDLNTIR